jgi:hypothetical protein
MNTNLRRIRSRGFSLEIDGGSLTVYPASRLTDAQRAYIKEHRGEIIKALEVERSVYESRGNSANSHSGVCGDASHDGREDGLRARESRNKTDTGASDEAAQGSVDSCAFIAGKDRDAKQESLEVETRWAADKPQFAARAFLYSVIRDGMVERGTLTSRDIRTEPAALEHLRERFPWLKVQWVQLITHPVYSGCQHYTGGVLCNADRSPEHVVKVGRCGRYEAASPVSEARS